ncbi:AtpZ/AtpI family protein [Peptostreptococcus porci]|uniref:AtpZ/AtpI family protein n=1 Tax=Peptostreptococcus porci TaxID=2652282 RepID=UPI002A911CA5|nr:AtpZ/AtpI family protein [Peptostreptococcus porci]MDY5436049.1 AtpZ/AtpI family protein [Peptostreptococcus porci]
MSKKSVWVEAMRSFSLISQLGIIVVVCIFGCGFFGRFLDLKFSTSPVFTLIFIFIGIGSAFCGVYRTLLPFMKKRK